MSYTLSLTAAKNDLAGQVDEKIGAYTPPGSQATEAREHLAKIAEVVPQLAEVIGVADDQLQISISGHANVGHDHASDWAAEFVTLTIGVVPPVAQRPGV